MQAPSPFCLSTAPQPADWHHEHRSPSAGNHTLEAPSAPYPSSTTEASQVCFGMVGEDYLFVSDLTLIFEQIKDLRAELDWRLSVPSLDRLAAAFTPPNHLTSGGNILGKLDDTSTQILQALHEDPFNRSAALQVALR